MTEEQMDQVIEQVGRGTNLLAACAIARISEFEVSGYLERGQIEEARLSANPRSKPRKSEEGCLEFWLELRAANAANQARIEQAILRAGFNEEWKALAWYAERRYPELYGKTATERKPQSLTTAETLNEIEG